MKTSWTNTCRGDLGLLGPITAQGAGLGNFLRSLRVLHFYDPFASSCVGHMSEMRHAVEFSSTATTRRVAWVGCSSLEWPQGCLNDAGSPGAALDWEGAKMA